MKITAMLLMFIIGACVHATTPNLAARAVRDDSHLECKPFYTDVGPTHVHSCVVESAKPTPIYCIVSTDMMGATCGPELRVMQIKQPDAAQPPQSAPPVPAPSPAPAASAAPAPAPIADKKPPHETPKK